MDHFVIEKDPCREGLPCSREGLSSGPNWSWEERRGDLGNRSGYSWAHGCTKWLDQISSLIKCPPFAVGS